MRQAKFSVTQKTPKAQPRPPATSQLCFPQ